MKKLRLIIGIVFVMTLCCLLAVSASAKWWDDNPFTDVKSTSWYYDAVRICNENGLFEGMTETTFATSTGMTRSMFVTVLAAADEDYDASQYTKSSFSDIRGGSWYLAPAEWANSIGVANGVGEGVFGPKNNITRQELAVMLYKYAQYKGKDVTLDGSVDMKAYPDNSSASSWASTALEWSVQNGLISGVANGSETILSPKGTATRAMVAQIMVKYLALDPVRQINGNDISLYTIVYGENEHESVAEAARELQKVIELSIGYTLPVVSDATEPVEYEILVGKTNREDMGLISFDRNSFEDDNNVAWIVRGNRLLITGLDIFASPEDGRTVYGTENAGYYFALEVLGATKYSTIHESVYNCEADPVISLDDGYTHIGDGPFMKTRGMITQNNIMNTGEYSYKSTFKTLMGGWVYGLDKMHEYWFTPTPCLTDEANKTAVLKNIDDLFNSKPSIKRVYFCINDTSQYCTCDNCTEMYRLHSSRSGAIAELANEVARMLQEKHPGCGLILAAYTYTLNAPKNIELEENIEIEILTIENCAGHAYDDQSCARNKNLMKQVKVWDEISSGIILWDHTGAPMATIMPFPDWDTMLYNVRLFADCNTREVMLNGALGADIQNGDMGPVRGYLYSIIYLDPYMTDEEFSYHKNKALEYFYGDGWKALAEYTDIIAALGNEKCHILHGTTDAYYNLDSVSEKVGYIDSLWEKAFAGAKDETQTETLTISYMSWLYLRQCAMFDEEMKNGTEAQKDVYKANNQLLYDTVTKYNIVWGEHGLNDFSAASRPDGWMIW